MDIRSESGGVYFPELSISLFEWQALGKGVPSLNSATVKFYVNMFVKANSIMPFRLFDLL